MRYSDYKENGDFKKDKEELEKIHAEFQNKFEEFRKKYPLDNHYWNISVASTLMILGKTTNQDDFTWAFKKWLVDFFAQNNTYKTNQTENYIYMRDSLQKMIAE